MESIAFLYGDIAIYWNYIIAALGIIAGCVFAFVLRPFTNVKKSALIFCIILSLIFSYAFSHLFFYYCHPEQFTTIKEAAMSVYDAKHSVVGIICGVLLSALLIGLCRKDKCVGKLLDTIFPGVVLTLALIRLSYYFTDIFHSKILVQNEIWQRLPFAVRETDAAGNVTYSFASFMVSAIILFLIAVVTVLFVRRKIKRPRELFLLSFVLFLLEEMVLEGTRNDALKVHFNLLRSLNEYVSFICFTMLVCGICLLIVFISNYRKAVKNSRVSAGKKMCALLLFIVGFICFGGCEYLVQRYTTNEVIFHLTQAGSAVLIAIGTIMTIYMKRRKRKKKKKEQKQNPKPKQDSTVPEGESI